MTLANGHTDTGYADPGSDGGLEENLASRGYRSLLADNDYDSDDDY